MKTILKEYAAVLTVLATFTQCIGMISVGTLSPKEAKELGITMKSRLNGDAGVMVWLEFKREGFLEAFNYAELRMENEKGEHRLSAMLRERAVVHGQDPEITSVSFSAEKAELDNCSFLVVAYGSTRGDVGYYLPVKDFLKLE